MCVLMLWFRACIRCALSGCYTVIVARCVYTRCQTTTANKRSLSPQAQLNFSSTHAQSIALCMRALVIDAITRYPATESPGDGRHACMLHIVWDICCCDIRLSRAKTHHARLDLLPQPLLNVNLS